MVTPAHLQAPLTDLLTELEAAVRAGDRARATELERAILQRLAAEAADQAALERRVRALMAELDQPEASPGLEIFDPLDFERGGWVRRGSRRGLSRLVRHQPQAERTGRRLHRRETRPREPRPGGSVRAGGPPLR